MNLLWPLLTVTAAAAQAEARVPILRIDGPYLYVPLGTSDGLVDGQTVTVYRRVEALDPRSGRTLTEAFPAGSGTVRGLGETLSRVVVPASLAVGLQPGDEVGLGLAPVAAPPRQPDATTPAPPVAVSAQDAAFREAFKQAAGSPRATRIRTWETFLQRWPGTELSRVVEVELAALRLAPGAADEPSTKPLTGGARAPAEVAEGVAVPVVFATPEPERVAAATLFYRLEGEESYRFAAMEAAGDTAFRAEVPAAATLRPGLEWFVEVRDQQGTVQSIDTSSTAPKRVEVRQGPRRREVEDRSEVTVLYEYVDFYMGSGADRYQHGEADFLYRLGVPLLYSMRLGAGAYSGVGGDTATLDRLGTERAAAASEDIGYNFGYTELEFRLAPWAAVIGRGLVGIDTEGLAGGVEGRLRLGREEGTSLDAGAARIGRIGTRYGIHLAWNSIESVPMSAGIEVTNVPGVQAFGQESGPDDYGVRLIYGARTAVSEHVELGARVGWALRNINHGGPSAGLEGVFAW